MIASSDGVCDGGDLCKVSPAGFPEGGSSDLADEGSERCAAKLVRRSVTLPEERDLEWYHRMHSKVSQVFRKVNRRTTRVLEPVALGWNMRIRRVGSQISSMKISDSFHTFMYFSTWKLVSIFFGLHTFGYLLFAVWTYAIVCFDAEYCNLGVKSYLDALYLSIETQTTIGYCGH